MHFKLVKGMHVYVLACALTILQNACMPISNFTRRRGFCTPVLSFAIVISRVYNRREGVFPTPVWYSVATLYGGHDLCNDNILELEGSRFAPLQLQWCRSIHCVYMQSHNDVYEQAALGGIPGIIAMLLW